MKNYLSYFAYFLLGITIAFLLTFVSDGLNLFQTKFWGVKQENARREVWEESSSYVEGKRQSLLKYYKEHTFAETEEDKQVIKNMVSIEFANFPIEKVNDHKLRQFLIDCKYSK